MEKSKDVDIVTVDEQERINWAYNTITSVVTAMDEVAAKPEFFARFNAELLKKMPDVIDAVMILTKEEHVGIMARFWKASTRLTGEWLKTMCR